ncbi:integral membrane protein [Candidatus Vecturithrix granuli]|uniref:Integral membrane protein n=1 Tax=Vecturithrix granuli TaxID=1499967 RepID=A0A081C0J7_VECG1|nr:integral membrane protein [Candidatus Vecturithrix granuli]
MIQQELKQVGAKKNTRKLVIKCLISGLLLMYLLYRADLSAIWDALKTASPWWVLIAFCLHPIGFWLTAVRWQMLLAARGAHLSTWYLLRSVLIGIFFNNFLPSTVGGDVYRAYDTSTQVGSKTESMTVVVVERLTGIFALGLFALFALLFGFSHFGNIPIIWLTLAGLLVIFVLFLLAMNHRVAKTVKSIFEHPELVKLPFLAKVQQKLKQIYDALCVYKRNRRVMVIAFILALFLQINVILHYYLIAYALALSVPVMYFFLIIPVVTVVLMVPVFINGIGGREAAFILLLGAFSVTSSQAIAFSWIAFGMILIQGIAGGIVYALRKD